MKIFDPTWKKKLHENIYHRHVLAGGDKTVETLEITKSKLGGYYVKLWSPQGYSIAASSTVQGRPIPAQKMAENFAIELGCLLNEDDQPTDDSRHARYGEMYRACLSGVVTGPHVARVTGWSGGSEVWTLLDLDHVERRQYSAVFPTSDQARVYILTKIDTDYQAVVARYARLNVPQARWGSSAKSAQEKET